MTAFDYRVDWRPISHLPGEHPASTRGDGGAFRGERLLLEAAQFRRLAVGARLRDPLARWWVQESHQRSAIDIVLCLDLSASMRRSAVGADAGGDAAGDAIAEPSGPSVSPLGLLADLVEATARSARRIGDRVGLVAAATTVDPAFSVRAGESLGRALAMATRLRRMADEGPLVETGGVDARSADGLLSLPRHLPARRSLVLLASDYLGPIAFWERVLSPLAGHQVVPLVIEAASPPLSSARWGLVRYADAEDGRARVLWMRPSLRRRLLAARLAHDEALDALFRARRLRPLRLQGVFDPAKLTAYFHSTLRLPPGPATTSATAGPSLRPATSRAR